MNISTIKKAMTMVATTIPMLTSTLGADLTITEGDFAGWTAFYFRTDDPNIAGSPPNVSKASAQRRIYPNTSNSYLQLVSSTVRGDYSFAGAIKSDFVHDPSVQGAITSLSVSADVYGTAVPDIGWQVVIEQGGRRYFSVPRGSFQGQRSTIVTVTNLHSFDFDTNPWAGRAGIPADGNRPDFGDSAPPLRFGILFCNAGFSNYDYYRENNLSLDNFRLVIGLATPALRLDIRVSQIEISWDSISSKWYQVQYKTAVSDSQWVPLTGEWLTGTGSKCHAFDAVDAGQPRRFYRVAVTDTKPVGK